MQIIHHLTVYGNSPNTGQLNLNFFLSRQSLRSLSSQFFSFAPLLKRDRQETMAVISELSGYTTTSRALPAAVSPGRLLLNDLFILMNNAKHIPGILGPIFPLSFRPLDELSIGWGNFFDCVFHGVLLTTQSLFLCSLPLCLILPLGNFLVYFIGFLVANFIFCLSFNGNRDKLFVATPGSGIPITGHSERWIFINGVSVGKRWLQNNIQQLANTFRRRIVAVHNPTSGILFDLIQCLIERDFSYNTGDVRQGYAYIKEQITDDDVSKVVLVLHSQGGIEGGMIIDWILTDVPEHKLSKLEVYTFGNAANHFNNPVRLPREGWPSSTSISNNGTSVAVNGTHAKETFRDKTTRAIGHIEHYANDGDFVACFGVLHFTEKKLPGQHRHGLIENKDVDENRFVGLVFKRQGTGHMFCQHYLNNMFTMKGTKVDEENEFMDSLASVDSMQGGRRIAHIGKQGESVKIKTLSRLWQYRNGGSPES
ncbi:hypothetical protein PVAG01_08127 [Phlyctema vagabunda]|uniref:DUF676 domain-containing protein n=1 Tax=Phlyctema vagabunda TaxID=108571 RepID=A0ABR4P8K0_9HELO